MNQFIELSEIKVLRESRNLLTNKGLVPRNCPKPSCLHIRKIVLVDGETRIAIDANPPQLPTDKEWLRYEIHETCKDKCGIQGNPNIGLFIKQDQKTGDIKKVVADWKSVPILAKS